MNIKDPSQLKAVISAIDNALDHGANPIAAFDADGTLWNTDLGETFFDYQIKNKLLEFPSNDPWDYYHELISHNPPAAYTWLAQINKGHPLSQVRSWAQSAFEEIQPPPLFKMIQAIITHLKTRHVKIYIVTASVGWAVEPGAKYLGIDPENVIGILTEVHDGIVTDIAHKTVSWRDGKVTRLLEVTNQIKPFFAAGNTTGDLALLECATHVKLANCAAPKGDRIYESEQGLLNMAQKKGWFRFEYCP